MRQSSIEYLVNIVQSCIPPNYIPIEIIQQAKEMHKQEIEQAWIHGDIRSPKNMEHINNSKEYYNKTFNP